MLDVLIKLTEYVYYRDGCRLYRSQMPINTRGLRDLAYSHVKKSEKAQVVGKIYGNADKHRACGPTTIQPLLNTFVLKSF